MDAAEAGQAETAAIATNDEIREELTRIMRGESGDRTPTVADRLKAIDLLGKSTGLWGALCKEPGEVIEFVGDDELVD